MLDTTTMKSLHDVAMEMMPEVEYHNKEHAATVSEQVGEVVPIDETVELRQALKVAAWFHDTGHAIGASESDGHEERSRRFARQELEGHGVEEAFIEIVENAILGTVFLEEPQTYEGKVLSDADVWNFGADWHTFEEKTIAARDEFAPQVSLDDWFSFRGTIMKRHTYYTDRGQELYEEQKQRNIQRIESEYGLTEKPPW